MQILMLGNSFIFANNMPKMLSELTGAEVIHHTRGGARLSEQLNPNTRPSSRTQVRFKTRRAAFLVCVLLHRTEDADQEVLAGGDHLEVRDYLTILWTPRSSSAPGPRWSLPLLDQLRQTGLACILVGTPFRPAVFHVNAAEHITAQFPDIRHWYMAGHSMGGTMASQFAADHPGEVDGLILLRAYLYGDIRLPILSPSMSP